MRRTAGLATIGLCALITFTGIAGAAERPSIERPVVESFTAETVGAIEEVSGGILGGLVDLLRLDLLYPVAESVKEHFSRVLLFPADSVTVSDAARREVRTYTESDWSMSVVGDTAIVETQSRSGLLGSLSGL